MGRVVVRAGHYIIIAGYAVTLGDIRMAGIDQDDSKRRYGCEHAGELDEHRKVALPASVSNNLENGFIIG